ncbi:MAG: ORF6N domain-containing protein [Spirochaetia bacterium]|jgi:phage regulator Rha-like protein|nr:ORF6N domain-containing protein [Spirochaetia bacterium]
MSRNDQIKTEKIRSIIHTIRGVQVILDSHLAELYRVETKTINRAVKRNINRFPDEFMFQLTDKEWTNLKYQSGTSSFEHGGRRTFPFVFTEQGVAMLSAVLKSEIAVKVSIQIINAFISMRKFINTNAQIFHRVDILEKNQLEYKAETNDKFNQIFDAIESKAVISKQGVFFDGQIFDAYKFVSDLIRSARKSIILVDNYVDDTVLTHLSKRNKDVKVIILTKRISKQLTLDVKKFNKQYPSIEIKEFTDSHDRFLIIDNSIVYHFGASLKDLGKKWFAFSRMDIEAARMISRLEQEYGNV